MDGGNPWHLLVVKVVRALGKLGLKLHNLAPPIVDPKFNGLDFVIRSTPDCKLEGANVVIPPK